jgi:nitroimidazol reductase NimA-like FMN-containing flavoprotein (pyridoxamine 5'-phosphate oxidase superfamily)
VLLDHERRFLLTRRVGHLATADSRAIPHVVPVCFTISQGTLYITHTRRRIFLAPLSLRPSSLTAAARAGR